MEKTIAIRLSGRYIHRLFTILATEGGEGERRKEEKEGTTEGGEGGMTEGGEGGTMEGGGLVATRDQAEW